MDTEPPLPPEKQPDADIIQFPVREKSELDKSIERHPAKGKKRIEDILGENGIKNTLDDPSLD